MSVKDILQIIKISIVFGILLSDESIQSEKELFCKCMDYWQCFATGGQLMSYCSYSNEVCCLSTNEKRSTLESKAAVCGRKEVDSGISGFAEPGEWPWHTALMIVNENLYICGGSLIDEKWVLTAAHCLDKVKSKNLKVRVGEYDVLNSEEADPHQEIEVDKVFIHPEFNSKTLVNDIALLLLKSSVQKKPNTNIICLPDSKTFTEQRLVDSNCYITGWGRVSEGGSYSSVLKEVSIPVWNRTRCLDSLRVHFGFDPRLSKTVLCGGDVGRDACDGDGGGGLFCQHNQVWYQIGIVSFGIGCGRKDSPGVYTNVLSYMNWIFETTSQL